MTTIDEARREQARIRARRHYELQQLDQMVVPVKVCREDINLLTDTLHLSEADTEDRAEIGRAIERMLASARGGR
jgi:hypothetical protein